MRFVQTPLLLAVFVAAITALTPALHAQSFDEGLKYYQQQNYEQAAEVFSQITTAEGYLFTAKSYYSLREYSQAQSNLNNIASDAPAAIRYEARYTSALINFQLKNFGEALNTLFEVSSANLSGDLNFNSEQLYGQILDYLTGPQRMQALEKLEYDEIKYDLFSSGLGKIKYTSSQRLYDQFRQSVNDDMWLDKAEEFESILEDEGSYKAEYGSLPEKLTPPQGTVYTLSFALPRYNSSAAEFTIVKALYLGVVLAVDEYNGENRSPKAYIRFTDTGTDANNMRPLLETIVEDHHTDALLGPLFSEQAESLIPIVSKLQLPTVAPMANNALNVQNSYLFQANPTFPLHGKQMARYAINELGLKNFGIIAQRNSNGAISAEAFRAEAEALGARITHYFIEDINSNQYQLSNYTRYFGSESPPIDAVYAPFTGQRSLTLIDLMARDIRSKETPITILGSQEYSNLNFRTEKYRDLDIYFTNGTFQGSSGARLAQFKNQYQRKFNTTGNLYSMIGYDIARFLLNALDRVGNPERLRSAISNAPKYEGLVRDIYFNGENVNEALKIFEVSSSGDLLKQN